MYSKQFALFGLDTEAIHNGFLEKTFLPFHEEKKIFLLLHEVIFEVSSQTEKPFCFPHFVILYMNLNFMNYTVANIGPYYWYTRK